MEHIIEALVLSVQPSILLAIILSTLFGVLVGIIPGLTATMSVALLAGLTFGFPPEIAIVSLIGVYVGAISGGSQAAILLNIPGTPSSAATALDGHALSRQGKAGLAIFLATMSSMLGTIVSAVFVFLLTPVLGRLGLHFHSYEYFWLAFFGILICGNLAGGDALKGWIAGLLGLGISMVGLDSITAFPRFAFGIPNLRAGLFLVPLMIALFGVPEILKMFNSKVDKPTEITPYKIGEGLGIIKKNWAALLRGGTIGSLMGIIPGVGEDVGGWLSYWSAKSSSKNPEEFGKGSYAGIIASESGSNACKGGAFIPTLSLAVPGSTSAAVMLAAFFMHGYRPGPALAMENPGLIYQVAIFLVLTSIAMVFIVVILSRFTVKILQLKKQTLMPIIFVFCVLGAFLVRYNFFDVRAMIIFGIIGFLLVFAKFPAAPLLLGMVLGDMAESNLIRGLRLSDGSLTPFFTRPISLFFVVVIAFLILSQIPFVRNAFTRLRKHKG